MIKRPLISSLLLTLATSIIGHSQHTFQISKASKRFDVRVTVEKCDDAFCRGSATFRISEKGKRGAFQVLKLAETQFMVEEPELVDGKRMYDAQSIVFFEDFDFDGSEDLAIRSGFEGGYGGPSYDVYLYSPGARKFTRNSAFTRLAQWPYLGMFYVEHKRKRIRVFSKSGCCRHYMEEYQVIAGRPRMVKEVSEYYNMKGDGMIDTDTPGVGQR